MRPIEVIHFVVGTPLPALRYVQGLEAMQDLVGGWIETASLTKDGLLIVCNEEGILHDLPVGFIANTVLGILPIYGNFFLCRERGSNFTSIKQGDAKTALELIKTRTDWEKITNAKAENR